MKLFKSLLAAVTVLAVFAAYSIEPPLPQYKIGFDAFPGAKAQTSPGLFNGQVPTAPQWNGYFIAKQDTLTAASATTVLHGNPLGGLPSFGKVDLTNDVANALPFANGGLGLNSGNSGGVLYFNTTSSLASSATLSNNQIVIGGGSGAAPVTLGSLGTTVQVLHGNASGLPSWGALNFATDGTGSVPVGNGGTGCTSAAVACLTTIGALSGSASSSNFLRGDGSWSQPSSNIPQNYIAGLTLSTAGSSGTFGITAGESTDSTNAQLMVQASAFTKTTGTWAVGTSNGCLDTGSIANGTWYSIFQIERTDLTSVDYLCSLSPSSPTMPTNYSFKRRIASMKTNGSAQWIKFTQFANQFLWDVPVQDYISQVLSGSTAITLTLSAPTGVQTIVNLQIRTTYNSVTSVFLLTSFDQADSIPSNSLLGWSVSLTAPSQYPIFNIRTNTSAQVRFRGTDGSGGSSDSAYNVLTMGWTDMRGQL